MKYNYIDNMSGYAWGKIFHYSIFKNFKFPEGYWFEDTPLSFILGCKNINIFNTLDSIYCYRKNPNSITPKAGNCYKSIDSYWITELCLEEFRRFNVPYNQKAYDYLLLQSVTIFIRTSRMPNF